MFIGASSGGADGVGDNVADNGRHFNNCWVAKWMGLFIRLTSLIIEKFREILILLLRDQ